MAGPQCRHGGRRQRWILRPVLEGQEESPGKELHGTCGPQNDYAHVCIHVHACVCMGEDVYLSKSLTVSVCECMYVCECVSSSGDGSAVPPEAGSRVTHLHAPTSPLHL